MQEFSNEIPDDEIDPFVRDLPQNNPNNLDGNDLPKLDSQQQSFCDFLRAGLPLFKAAGLVGMSPKRAKKFVEEDERAAEALVAQKAQVDRDTNIDVETLTTMALEYRSMAANTIEGMRVVEFLAKLHKVGGYAPNAGKGSALEEGPKRPKNAKQMQRKSDADLAELAELGYDLEPVPVSEQARDNIDDPDNTAGLTIDDGTGA